MRKPLLITLCFVLCSGMAQAGTITGVVSVRAEEKALKPRRYYMGPYRSGQRREAAERLSFQDVVLYVEAAEGSAKKPSGAPEPVIVQTNEAFSPQVLPIRLGTEVSFPNRDTYYHNVFSVMAGDRFDLGRYAQGETGKKTFDTAGVVVVRCEIHPRMKAYILVLDTPFFTVPDSTGRFSLPDFPPGQVTLKAWHPTKGEQARVVVVTEEGEVEVGFDF